MIFHLDSFKFDSTNNKMTIPGGSWSYVSKRQYEIYVSTWYLNNEYYQKVLINIEQPPELPISILT